MRRMYVVRAEQGGFWCGLNHWDTQLRKAQIFHSLKYAGDVVGRHKEYNPQIVEVSLAIVNEPQTNADRIRSMSDEELCEMLTIGTGGFDCGVCRDSNACDRECELHCAEWLKQPVRGGE